MDSQNILLAFGLTLFAGLSTGIGSALVLIVKQTDKKFLSFALGLSAGVMIYVSFVEILPKAVDSLTVISGERGGTTLAVVAFFIGIAIIAIIDKFVPSAENPHEMPNLENIETNANVSNSLMRMGLFSALAIAIHNFPEGIATFISTVEDPSLGIPVAFAIAIHNIPEGIAVAVPIYFATGNRKKAFKLSLLSGISEPIGAVVAFFILMQFQSDMLFGLVFAAVAGIMVYISLDELLPTAEKYGEHHICIAGLVSGMAVMAGSLLLFL